MQKFKLMVIEHITNLFCYKNEWMTNEIRIADIGDKIRTRITIIINSILNQFLDEETIHEVCGDLISLNAGFMLTEHRDEDWELNTDKDDEYPIYTSKRNPYLYKIDNTIYSNNIQPYIETELSEDVILKAFNEPLFIIDKENNKVLETNFNPIVLDTEAYDVQYDIKYPAEIKKIRDKRVIIYTDIDELIIYPYFNWEAIETEDKEVLRALGFEKEEPKKEKKHKQKKFKKSEPKKETKPKQIEPNDATQKRKET